MRTHGKKKESKGEEMVDMEVDSEERGGVRGRVKESIEVDLATQIGGVPLFSEELKTGSGSGSGGARIENGIIVRVNDRKRKYESIVEHEAEKNEDNTPRKKKNLKKRDEDKKSELEKGKEKRSRRKKDVKAKISKITKKGKGARGGIDGGGSGLIIKGEEIKKIRAGKQKAKGMRPVDVVGLREKRRVKITGKEIKREKEKERQREEKEQKERGSDDISSRGGKRGVTELIEYYENASKEKDQKIRRLQEKLEQTEVLRQPVARHDRGNNDGEVARHRYYENTLGNDSGQTLDIKERVVTNGNDVDDTRDNGGSGSGRGSGRGGGGGGNSIVMVDDSRKQKSEATAVCVKKVKENLFRKSINWIFGKTNRIQSEKVEAKEKEKEKEKAQVSNGYSIKQRIVRMVVITVILTTIAASVRRNAKFTIGFRETERGKDDGQFGTVNGTSLFRSGNIKNRMLLSMIVMGRENMLKCPENAYKCSADLKHSVPYKCMVVDNTKCFAPALSSKGGGQAVFECRDGYLVKNSELSTQFYPILAKCVRDTRMSKAASELAGNIVEYLKEYRGQIECGYGANVGSGIQSSKEMEEKRMKLMQLVQTSNNKKAVEMYRYGLLYKDLKALIFEKYGHVYNSGKASGDRFDVVFRLAIERINNNRINNAIEISRIVLPPQTTILSREFSNDGGGQGSAQAQSIWIMSRKSKVTFYCIMNMHLYKLITATLVVLLSFYAKYKYERQSKERAKVAELVEKVVDQLKSTAKNGEEDAYCSVLQVRDELMPLGNVNGKGGTGEIYGGFSREQLWRQVCQQVEQNSNIRTNNRMIRGVKHRTWEYIGR